MLYRSRGCRQMLLSACESADRATQLVAELVLTQEPVSSRDRRQDGQRAVRERRIDEHPRRRPVARELCCQPQAVAAFSQVVINHRHVNRGVVLTKLPERL